MNRNVIKKISLLCLLLRINIVTGCKNDICSITEYKQERARLTEQIGPKKLSLSDKEQKAAIKFEELKNDVYRTQAPAQPWISRPFYEVKDKIAQTELYEVLKQMPKGGILHLHPSAMGDLPKAIDIALGNQNAYVKIEGNSRGMIAFTAGEGWIKASEIGKYGLDKNDLLKCITIGSEDEDIKDIWPEFENIFGRMYDLCENYPYENYLYDAIEYYAVEDNVQHLELRVHCPGEHTIAMYKNIEKRLAANGIAISIRLICSDGRTPYWQETPQQRLESLKESVRNAFKLKAKYPEMVAGFDVYAEEDKGLSASMLAELLLDAKNEANDQGVELEFYLHNGESIFPVSLQADDEYSWNGPKHYNNNIIDAYLLNAKRVGHGFELARLPKLAELYKEKDICIELCPISNQLLRYFKDIRNHPGINLFNQDVAITLSPDDPAIFGYKGVTFDYWAAVIAWDMPLGDVKKLILNSIEYSSLETERKTILKDNWELKWDSFINTVLLKQQPH
ncbi:MAG: hypothetical protein JW745_01820 [Sedimentisphaerales bacterium]|nr:hypothetical protein [Sedimentisphaerales bacterium]MBN2841488.1 hypothetical protein [Sedimentisphaerales bacterium]